MRDAACDTGVIIADAVALAELPGGTGYERVRIDAPTERIRADSIAAGAGQLQAVLAEILD